MALKAAVVCAAFELIDQVFEIRFPNGLSLHVRVIGQVVRIENLPNRRFGEETLPDGCDTRH